MIMEHDFSILSFENSKVYNVYRKAFSLEYNGKLSPYFVSDRLVKPNLHLFCLTL